MVRRGDPVVRVIIRAERIGVRHGSTILPEKRTSDDDTTHGDGFIVVVYDNDHNTFEQVASILQKATGCTQEEASIETWEVHHLGKSVVHHGGRPECERVAGIVRTIGIRVEVVSE